MKYLTLSSDVILQDENTRLFKKFVLVNLQEFNVSTSSEMLNY